MQHIPCCRPQVTLLRFSTLKGRNTVRSIKIILTAVLLAVSGSVMAADLSGRIDAAKAFYQKGDMAKAAHELEAVLTDLQDHLGRSLTAAMPAPLSGWQADEAEYEGLSASGGGLSVTRAYSKNDSSMNASIILDNPAVDAALDSQMPQQAVKKVKIGTEDATLRWDGNSHSGDITVVLGHRVLLQIEGEDLSSGDVLVDQAKGFDLAIIRKVVGLN